MGKPQEGTGTISGNTTISTSSSNSVNVIGFTAAFKDLQKVAQQYFTDNIARYDVWVDLAVANVTTASGATSAVFTHNGNTVTIPTASATNSISNPLITLGNLGSNPNSTIDEIKSEILDYSAITVNNTTIKTEYLNRSFAYLYKDGATDDYTLIYRLVIAEFDANDSASLSADYEIHSWLKNYGGFQTTKIRVSYTNSGEADKPIKPLYLKPVRKGEKGLYNVYVVNGVVFIDYAQDISGSTYVRPTTSDYYAAIPLGFKFYEDAAATVRVPASGKYAYVIMGDSDTPARNYDDKFFVDVAATDRVSGKSPYEIGYINYTLLPNAYDVAPASVNGAPVKNDADCVLGVWLPNKYGTSAYGNTTVMSESKNKTMKVAIQDDNYRYRTGDIKVVFRPLARNLITTAVIVERYLTIAVGESVELTIESASATTYADIVLSEITSVKSHVYIDGMKVTGISVGTAQVQVSASNKVIDQITVNVVATKETVTPDVVVAQWRVLARKLNIRSGPGTNYGKVGTLVMNQVVAGNDTGTGWVEIGAGQYVSKQYVVPVSGSATGIGNATVNASSLNVRSGPGSSYAKTGSLTRGTVVEIIAVQNGWAQLATGGWVSVLYLI